MCVGAGEADRHLKRALVSARGWADAVVVFGDGPDRVTRELIAGHATNALIGATSVHGLGEHFVRNELLALADTVLEPDDIVVVIDADEQLATHQLGGGLTTSPVLIRKVLLALAGTPADSWNVHFWHLWNPEGSMHRADGAWQPSVGTRIYRHRPGLRVQSYGGWVCPPLPRHLMRGGPPVLEMLHWGYALPEDRPWKHERYSRLTGHSSAHVDSILTEPTLAPVP